MLSLFWRFNSFWRLLQVFLVSEGLYKGLVNDGELNALSKKELNMSFLDEKVMNEALLYKKMVNWEWIFLTYQHKLIF